MTNYKTTLLLHGEKSKIPCTLFATFINDVCKQQFLIKCMCIYKKATNNYQLISNMRMLYLELHDAVILFLAILIISSST
mmetsp:Transcript_35804/g.47273  ORF Transcript_35804/g.47273 Transcript_35804/m.47273 type:complete len:80 (-) Transcript_35804:83-322(-)